MRKFVTDLWLHLYPLALASHVAVLLTIIGWQIMDASRATGHRVAQSRQTLDTRLRCRLRLSRPVAKAAKNGRAIAQSAVAIGTSKKSEKF